MTAAVGVGLIGLGTVGSAVAARLVGEWEMLGARAGATPVLRRVAVRDPQRARDVALPSVRLDGDATALVDDPAVGVVVEVMGGVDAACALMDRALRGGKPVVTANKAAMAAHGLELATLARESGTSLRYEAAAGGGVPVVALLRDSLRGDRITELEMIINGTTNIILTRMERDGVDLVDALQDAQRRGFAEADPSADVDGHDAAAKLVLLSRLAFDAPLGLDDVTVGGIRDVTRADIACAHALGGSVKLVAHAQAAGGVLALAVRTAVVLAGHPLHGVDDAANAVVITTDLAERVTVAGIGGGAGPTASAVVSDVVAAVRAPAEPPPLPGGAAMVAATGSVERGAYVRVRLRDAPDAAALVVAALEDRGLDVTGSTAARGGDGGAELAVVTAPAPREMLDHAVETLDSLAAVDGVAAVMDCIGPARR
jgi:homoserine dehydrogenase